MAEVSIIISTYNRPDRLIKAVESVMNQTFTDWELIIVDDHSTKDLPRFDDSRINTIILDKNFGCDTHPKNVGILKSTGKYILFLDDDNQYRPDHIQALYGEMKRSEEGRDGVLVDDRLKSKGLDVVYGDRWLIDETGNIQPQLGISSDFNPAFLMQRNFIDTSDVLIRRQALFDVGGFDESVKKYIDWNLWCRMSKAGKRFKRVPIIITDYHLHEDMKSNRVKNKGEKENPNSFIPTWDPYDCLIELPYLGKEIKEPRVAIFSLTMNRLDETKKSFKSLHKTAGYEFDHYIVDNGSTDETFEWLTNGLNNGKYKFVYHFDENMGISIASNKAIDLIKERGDYDIVIKSDNDAIYLTDGWLAKMVEIWKSNHTIAMSPYIQGLKDNPGGSPRLDYGNIGGEYVGVVTHLGGICCMADASAYDNFRWDTESFLHGVQDMEFSQYLKFSGYTMIYLENYFVNHGVGGTEVQHKKYKEYFEKRKQEKITKYEGNK